MVTLQGVSVQFLEHLAGSSVRSVCLAAIVLCILAIARRSAHLQHAAWTIVAVSMLLLPVASALLPALRLAAPLPLNRYEVAPADPVRRVIMEQLMVLNVDDVKPLSVRSSWNKARVPQWPVVVTGLYLAISVAVLFRLILGVVFTARLVGRSTVLRDSAANHALTNIAEEHGIPYPLPQVCESDRIRVACVVGSDTLSILLPVEWHRWDTWKLRAVLAHELTHIRRADWTVSLLAEINKAVFWFHPLAWWLAKKLNTLSEQACDEASVFVTGDPARYAEVLLDVAAALPPHGRRFVYGSPGMLSMASQPQVSSRIDRILDLQVASCGVFPKRAWAMVVVVTLPLFCALAAAQVSAPPKPVDSGNTLASLTWPSVGMKVSSTEAEQLEREIANGSRDLQARAKLIAYYNYNALAGKAEPHVEWIVEHHPDSQEAGAPLVHSFYPPPNEAHLQRKRELWLRQTAIHSGNPRVLGNAAKFMASVDPTMCEQLLKRAIELDRQDSTLPAQLVELYVSALRSGFYRAAGLDHPITRWNVIDSAFASRVKDDLERSKDAKLVGSVGSALGSDVLFTREFRQNQQHTVDQVRKAGLDYAEALIRRAQSLEPAAAQWTQALTNLQTGIARESAANAEGPRVARPPVTETANVQRVRVGVDVQESKLLQGDKPVYPPVAQSARIQGVVRFQVVIGQDGRVSNITLNSGHPLLVPAATEALKTHVYKPTTLNGQLVEVETTVNINFTLNQ